MDILNKDKITFKDLEQLIYEIKCQEARELTADLLSAIDEQLHQERDRSEYRDKGYRQTTIKTVYGEVEYSRHVYLTRNDEGKNSSVFLLDKELGMDTIGLISTNLAEKIAEAAADVPFRKAASHVSGTTGQTISHSGAWNVVQALGEKLAEEEELLVKEFQNEQPRGKKETQVLFEEMDGVWIKQQKDGGKKAPGMEVKVGTMYEGWKDTAGKRSNLANKTVLAGIERSDSFHEKWEAKIQSVYDPEKIGVRIFNGDGGSWVHDEYDANAIKQLDRFHVVKAIRQKIAHDAMKAEMLDLLKEDKIDELLENAQIYLDSISTAEGDTTEEKNAAELKEYLENHKDQLSRYQARGREIPKPPTGILYKNMGVQENQNCTLITLRMKGKRKRWSEKSAANMVRLLYYRENRELMDAVDRYTDGAVWTEPVKATLNKPLSAAKVDMVDGKGNNRYYDVINVHLPILDSTNHRTVKVFKRLIY
ncbi:MAG: ISLre2 family transposase [Mogibacterium sp.]|nr:ISLre2 family transposase [Mogibacterium sp.]